jgi:hypothetical protein
MKEGMWFTERYCWLEAKRDLWKVEEFKLN